MREARLTAWAQVRFPTGSPAAAHEVDLSIVGDDHAVIIVALA